VQPGVICRGSINDLLKAFAILTVSPYTPFFFAFKDDFVLVFTGDHASVYNPGPSVLITMVIGNKKTFITVFLDDLMRIDIPAFYFAENDIADLIFRCPFKSEQRTTLQNGQHGAAEGFHLSRSACFKPELKPFKFVHVLSSFVHVLSF